MSLIKKTADALLLGRIFLARTVAHLQEGRLLESIRSDATACTGRFNFRSKRSIWIHGETPEQFIAADAVIASLKRVAAESCFVMTSHLPRTEAWLRERFPDDRVFPAPWNRREYAKRFIRQISPQMIVLLQTADGFGSHALRLAAAQKIAAVLIDGRAAPCREPRRLAARLAAFPLAHLCVQEEADAERLRKAGVSPERITVTGDLGFEAALLAPRRTPDYLRRELRVGNTREVRFILAEGVHRAEERDLLEALIFLRARHPGLVLLWKPKSRSQLRRFGGRLAGLDLPMRRWNESSADEAAVILLDPAAATAPFHTICSAVVAGGTFTPLPAFPPFEAASEPVSVQAPVIFGPFVPERAAAAHRMLRASAALQCRLEALGAVIDSLIEDAGAAGAVTARAARLMQGARGAGEKTVQAIAPLYPALPDEQPARAGWKVTKTREEKEAMEDPAAAIPKIGLPDWDSFRRRIGPHRSILCLGNGPTSEDPAVVATPHDCLFRANWRWKDRGLLTQPQAVFVGDPVTIGNLALPCVFIFPDPEREFNALRSRRILARQAPVEHFTLTQSSCGWLADLARDAHARPSNGALMIATASALAPERLTIAGLDLFSHSDGRYPGDLQGVNTYSHCHDPEHELAVIERALLNYAGELVILSPILVEALKRRNFPMERLTAGPAR